MMSKTIKQLLGQKLMLGVQGDEPSREVIELFQKTHAGGLILFHRNFKSAAQLKSFISTIEDKIQRRLLVAVDHEGGRVIHLSEGATIFPDNLALGQTDNEKYAFRQGEIEAVELRRLGIDVNLAPTLDVITGSFSPNIGIRSYGRDPERVSRLGSARIRGMQSKGLSACAKHFPGQGQSSLDAHNALPVLETSEQEIREIHLQPFRAAIESGVDTFMTSHPIYPKLKACGFLPATFSEYIVKEMLRKELGFEGVIFTDDLEMGALRDLCSIGEAALRAAMAGHDMLLICSSAKDAYHALECLCEGYKTGVLDLRELEESSRRIEYLISKRAERFTGGEPVPEAEGAMLAATVVGDAFRDFKKDEKLTATIRNSRTQTPPLIIFPKISELSRRITVEAAMLNEETYIRGLFEKAGRRDCVFKIVGLNPSLREIKALESEIVQAPFTVFFCYDAHLNENSKTLLCLVEKRSANPLMVFLRDPYDASLISGETPFFQAFGFRSFQIEGIVHLICGEPESQAQGSTDAVPRGKG
ncbi:MAG: beta-N-acetylhexosaminidase [Candidatus Omnitrophica bacterium]|nr:beta-N-acetylhexosaminidase [Candidatus Omnitrophota bacterium]